MILTGSHIPKKGLPMNEPYQQPYQSPPQPQPTPPAYAPPAPSPFARAWQDIKGTPDAFATYGFKGLVNCVPVLNFCFYGNAGKWQQQAADGICAPIERKVVDGENFTSGFFYFVISIIVALLLCVVAMVPFIGALAFFAASFFANTFALLMYQRYLSFGSFGDAFALSDIWDKCKRSFGSLWVATFVPQLIVGVIVGAIGIGWLIISIGIASLYSSSYMSVAGILSMLSVIGIGGVIYLIVCMFAGVIGTVWSMRGCGYWVHDNVPEWNSVNARIAKEQQMAAQMPAQQQPSQQPWAQSPQAPQPQPQAQPVPQYAPPAPETLVYPASESDIAEHAAPQGEPSAPLPRRSTVSIVIEEDEEGPAS